MCKYPPEIEKSDEFEAKPLTPEEKVSIERMYKRTVSFILYILEMLRVSVELLTSDANASNLESKQQQRLYKKFVILIRSLHIPKAANLFKNHNKALKEVRSFKPLNQKWTQEWITTSHLERTISILLLCEVTDVSRCEDDFTTLSSIGATTAWLKDPKIDDVARVSFKIYEKDPQQQAIILNRLYTLLAA